MKASLIVSPILLGGLAMASGTASAGDSVTVNGARYTCTSSCVVQTNGNGGYTVTDCCGGRVTRVIRTPPPED